MEGRRRSGPALATVTGVLTAVALVGSLAGGIASAGSHTPEPTPLFPGASPSPLQTVLRTPEPSASSPSLTAPSALLLDLDTGQVLFRKAARQRRPIASLTKIMTAHLVLEAVALSEVVTISPEAPAQAGSRVGLVAGERISVEDLLVALLLGSANDAAVALATHVGGSVEGFVELMNRRARALRLRDTVFVTPSGLDATGFSTAIDVARLTRRAFESAAFADIVGTKVRDISASEAGTRTIQSRNVLLWLYPGAIGVKSGSTAEAGYTVSAAAEREGIRLLAVVLGAPESAFDDAAALLDYGFTAFEPVTLVHEGDPVGTVEVEGQAVDVLAGADLVRLVPRGASADVRRSLRPLSGLTLPLEAGQRVGRVVVRMDGRVIGSVPAVSSEDRDVERPDATRPGTQGPLQTAMRLLVALVRLVLAPFL